MRSTVKPGLRSYALGGELMTLSLLDTLTKGYYFDFKLSIILTTLATITSTWYIYSILQVHVKLSILRKASNLHTTSFNTLNFHQQ